MELLQDAWDRRRRDAFRQARESTPSGGSLDDYLRFLKSAHSVFPQDPTPAKTLSRGAYKL
ncbi:MAG: hypothetical protein Q8Q08_01010 [Candidatus Omnitrophota bacterium]|nr:hypothetical protein [Candidatus Omnitrophota bacterium]